MKVEGYMRVAALVLALSAALPAAAAEYEGLEAGIQVGGILSDSQVTGKDSREVDPIYGARAGVIFTENWGFMLDFLQSDVETEAIGDVETFLGRGTFEYLWRPLNDARPGTRFFTNFGIGKADFDYDTPLVTDFDRTFASVGVGQRIQVADFSNVRWELRYDQSIEDDEGLNGADVSQALLLVGINFGPGGKAVDTDGDGVYDRRDDCPNTPRGATVDERGCPTDSDGDGVYDGIDQCPDTPRGWPVDSNGCPKDSDGDGVADGEDDCPNTPSGATVDARGCPKDSDGDGVYDGIDRCPDTPQGARVDARGCPKDGDGDGVPDGLDRCPNTPSSVKVVDKDGCAVDTDGDGVPDGQDKCPNTPRGTEVDADGCPKPAPLFVEEQRNLVLEGVFFEVNSADLTANSVTVLDRVAESLNAWPEVRVEVGGHTDSDGAASYNQSLSERRAQSVRAYLISKGVDGSRITAAGYGEASPRADNATRAGKAQNRRVELTRLD